MISLLQQGHLVGTPPIPLCSVIRAAMKPKCPLKWTVLIPSVSPPTTPQLLSQPFFGPGYVLVFFAPQAACEHALLLQHLEEPTMFSRHVLIQGNCPRSYLGCVSRSCPEVRRDKPILFYLIDQINLNPSCCPAKKLHASHSWVGSAQGMVDF